MSADVAASGEVPRPVASVTSQGDSDADAQRLQRMQEGDERALGELYDRWSSRIYALALAMVRDAGEAEDVTEETFWQAWRQSSRFDPTRGSASAWLLTIARSRALDRLRARRRRPEDPLADDAAASLFADAALPDQAVELSERARAVRAAMTALPAEQREVLGLAYFAGLSQTEIAERTGLPLGTIKTRVRLAMLKLREPLSVFGGGTG